jgi:hypothetical protein
MEWTIRLEVKTGRGEGESLDLATITRPAVPAVTMAAAEVGLSLAEGKALLAKLQAEMVRRQLAEYVALGRVCPRCQAGLRIKDRRPRRLRFCQVSRQMLVGQQFSAHVAEVDPNFIAPPGRYA